MLQEVKEKIEKEVDARKPELVEISSFIHDHPELGYEEFQAVEKLTNYLEEQGAKIEKEYCGIPTSFKSTYKQGDGSVHFAICAEYDALPDLGHACGHNVICTSAVGAYLATKKTMETFDISGQVSLIGTPAEEGGGGKIKLLEKGGFEGIDAATMVHPTSGTTRIAGRCTTTHTFTIDYAGKSAHAASQPFKGINALDAANLFFSAVSMLRQQVTSDVRMSGIITEGGQATNMIPEHTQIQYMARCMEEDELDSLVKRVKDCIQAAALATGCDVEIKEERGYAARTYSQVLGNICREALEDLGEPVLPDFPDDFGSTDFGNISQIMPTTNPYFSLNKTRVSLHSKEYEKIAASPITHTAIERSAKAMSRTVIESFLNPELIEQAKKEKTQGTDINARPR
ncbi:amidohydrolase [Tetragenococcus halophilus subsp. flandriensis]|uniref:M20 family metallopeptidase n=1 Tax=Tetragenococcus halophilus TaxID=51669 RepID=UPI0023E925D5|nr:M20 family metallopeptidase [Tetragenococcus halophilus]GMA09319.1 amidohydrolase [Tetragenococcus halophilus subsp. flandriensis]